ncbi:putative endo-1,3(4)-beta-glucanase [Xylariales sp. PMI_506]|nr:putative endo-1,3(4)-beta-glucanase [Xylariales sp. PMI_506]
MYTKGSLLSAAALAFARLASAGTPPDYSGYGYGLAWYDDFSGAAGSSPNTNNWNIITGYLNVNGESETYSSSNANVQLSGGETLQLVPWLNNGAWTSGRVESTYYFTPTANQYTVAEAQLRFGESTQAQKEGIWPAFWMLGEVLRQGGSWPECGELDIMEMIDGVLTGYGTAHCDVYPGGICNEGTGLSASTGVPDYEWHTWRIIWNNTPTDWTQQTITWYLDGVAYHTISGANMQGNEAVWNTLAHSNMYFILNVAVGGSWPGYPNGATLSGYSNMMEVNYVAHYVQ